MDIANIRYILFMIGAKDKDHDGIIFQSHKEAKEYCKEAFEEKYCDRAVIGMFLIDPNAQYMDITMVETFGFKSDVKNINQLQLFN